MPMLAVTRHSWPLSSIGLITADSSLRAMHAGLLAVAQILQQHHELVAAQARHDVAGAQALLQALGHFAQQRVAGLVAEAVVDELEAVEVDEQHRKLALVATRQREHVVEQLAEHHAVGQPGQAVVRGQVLNALLGLLARRDVARHAAVAREAAVVVEQRLAADADVAALAVSVDVGVLEVAKRPRAARAARAGRPSRHRSRHRAGPRPGGRAASCSTSRPCRGPPNAV